MANSAGEGTPGDHGPATDTPTQRAQDGGHGWRTPAGVSAIAAAVGTLVAVVALFVTAGGGPDSGSDPQTASESPSAPESHPGASSEPADVPLPSARSLADILPGVRDAAARALGSAEEPGPVVRRGGDVVSADLPRSWEEWELSPWLADDSDEAVGLVLLAAPDISRFYGYEGPGFFVGVSSLESTDPEAVLENVERGWEMACVRVGENTIEGPMGIGHYEVYRDCDPVSSMVVDVAIRGEYSLYMHLRLTDVAHVEYLQQMFESLDVRPPIPLPSDDATGDQTLP